MHPFTSPRPAWALTLAGLMPLATLVAQPRSDGVRRSLAQPTERTLTALLGRHPFTALAAWARTETEADQLWPAERAGAADAMLYEALVCGLWSEDADTAFAAACFLPERMLDLTDIERYVAVCRPRLFDRDLRFAWDTFKHVLDPTQVQDVLSPGAVVPDCDARHVFIGDLHRSFRMDHAPQLAALSQHDDPIVRRPALRHLALLGLYADGPRPLIARALLGWHGPSAERGWEPDPAYAPREYELEPAAAGGGWSPELRACLRRWYFDLDPPRAANQPVVDFGPWLLRWAEDEAPGTADHELVRELLATEREDAWAVATRAALRLRGDAALTDRLKAWADEQGGSDGVSYWLAHAAGDDAMRAALRTAAAEDAMALAVLLEVDPEAAVAAWGEHAGEAPEEAVDLLLEAHELFGYAPLRLPSAAYAVLRRALDGRTDQLAFTQLHALLEALPPCRTRATVAAYADKLTPGQLDECLAALLEVFDETAFRLRLAAAAEDPDGEASDTARQLLLELGAPEHGELLAAWVADGNSDLLTLARSAAHDAVRAVLRQELEQAALGDGEELATGDFAPLAAAAAAAGLPERTSAAWQEALARAPVALVRREYASWREDVLAGAPARALLACLQALPAHQACFSGVGLVDDPALLEHLRALRHTPGARVQDVIGELALAGDEQALAELQRVREKRLYGWMDDAPADVRTLGRRMDLVPFWVDELGTVCCRRNGAAWALEQLAGFDAHDMAEHGLLTQRQYAQAWADENLPHLRFSRIAQRFVVGPRP